MSAPSWLGKGWSFPVAPDADGALEFRRVGKPVSHKPGEPVAAK